MEGKKEKVTTPITKVIKEHYGDYIFIGTLKERAEFDITHRGSFEGTIGMFLALMEEQQYFDVIQAALYIKQKRDSERIKGKGSAQKPTSDNEIN